MNKLARNKKLVFFKNSIHCDGSQRRDYPQQNKQNLILSTFWHKSCFAWNDLPSNIKRELFSKIYWEIYHIYIIHLFWDRILFYFQCCSAELYYHHSLQKPFIPEHVSGFKWADKQTTLFPSLCVPNPNDACDVQTEPERIHTEKLPIEMSKSFPWTIIMQILMVKLQNLNTGKKIGFSIDCFTGARKWGQNYDFVQFSSSPNWSNFRPWN